MLKDCSFNPFSAFSFFKVLVKFVKDLTYVDRIVSTQHRMQVSVIVDCVMLLKGINGVL